MAWILYEEIHFDLILRVKSCLESYFGATQVNGSHFGVQIDKTLNLQNDAFRVVIFVFSRLESW